MNAHFLLLEAFLNGRLRESGVSIPVSSGAVLEDELVEGGGEAVDGDEAHTDAQPPVEDLREGVPRCCFYHEKDNDVYEEKDPKTVLQACESMFIVSKNHPKSRNLFITYRKCLYS